MTAPGNIGRLSIGTMALTGLYDPNADLRHTARALAMAIDAGIDRVHTAEHYRDGLAFRLVHDALASGHGTADVRVTAKVDGAPTRLLDGREGIRRTCRGLGRQRLDHVQLVESRGGLGDHWSLEAIMDDLEGGAIGSARCSNRPGPTGSSVRSGGRGDPPARRRRPRRSRSTTATSSTSHR